MNVYWKSNTSYTNLDLHLSLPFLPPYLLTIIDAAAVTTTLTDTVTTTESHTATHTVTQTVVVTMTPEPDPGKYDLPYM